MVILQLGKRVKKHKDLINDVSYGKGSFVGFSGYKDGKIVKK